MIGIGTAAIGELRAMSRLIDIGDGMVVVELPDGTILSVQPDGRQETRPAGTRGVYERAIVSGQMLIYCPDGVHVFALPYLDKVPG